MTYLWLPLLSLASSFTVFFVLRKCLVPRFCEHCLRGKVALLLKNGDSNRDVRDKFDLKTLQEHDILEISMLIMTWLVGAITSVVSVVVFLETMEDTLHSRSVVLIPYVHFAAWYYIVDTYAMFITFVTKSNLSHKLLKTQLLLFAKSKWSSLLHHFLLMTFGYPVMANAGIRGYKGDFYAAALLAQDFSNPFLANAKIMKILGLTKSVTYSINGAVLIVVFLMVRVLNMPLCVLVFAAQYHNWNVWVTLGRMRWICYTGIILVVAIQSYWFLALLKLAKGVVKNDWKDRVK